MKVCTDACVFGAYVAKQIYIRGPVEGCVLDIGTGTGLLALMIAQETKGIIDALEIDEAAFQQARVNFETSTWKERLNAINVDAISFNPGKKYDWIISNPPFFEGDLKSANNEKNLARHQTRLTLQQLLLVITAHLSPQGSFAVLLPSHRAAFFIEILSQAGYLLTDQVLLQHTVAHPVFRHILFFSMGRNGFSTDKLIIREVQGNYTPQFKALMKEYYL